MPVTLQWDECSNIAVCVPPAHCPTILIPALPRCVGAAGKPLKRGGEVARSPPGNRSVPHPAFTPFPINLFCVRLSCCYILSYLVIAVQ